MIEIKGSRDLFVKIQFLLDGYIHPCVHELNTFSSKSHSLVVHSLVDLFHTLAGLCYLLYLKKVHRI